MTRVEELKDWLLFSAAGAEAYRQGLPKYYGCHYGMKETRAFAINEFTQGYEQAQHEERV